MQEEKKYIGYGYHGGGRKKMDESDKKIYKNITISGTPEQLDRIKQIAKSEGITVSKLVIKAILNE